MKRVRVRFLSVALILLTTIPLLLSIIFRKIVEVSDYIAQGGLILMMVLLPFFTPLETSFAKSFGILYGTWLVWGIWRFFYFDPVTQNDIPGIGYFVAPLLWCGISAAIYQIRKAAHKK